VVEEFLPERPQIRIGVQNLRSANRRWQHSAHGGQIFIRILRAPYAFVADDLVYVILSVGGFLDVWIIAIKFGNPLQHGIGAVAQPFLIERVLVALPEILRDLVRKCRQSILGRAGRPRWRLRQPREPLATRALYTRPGSRQSPS
jgi:hypothetical protein